MTVFLFRQDGTCGRMEIKQRLTHLPVGAREAEKAILDYLNAQEGVKSNPFTKAIII